MWSVGCKNREESHGRSCEVSLSIIVILYLARPIPSPVLVDFVDYRIVIGYYMYQRQVVHVHGIARFHNSSCLVRQKFGSFKLFVSKSEIS
jgi:hypothetical protein